MSGDGRLSKSSNSGTVGGSPGRVPGLYVGRRSSTSRSTSAGVAVGRGSGAGAGAGTRGGVAASTARPAAIACDCDTRRPSIVMPRGAVRAPEASSARRSAADRPPPLKTENAP